MQNLLDKILPGDYEVPVCIRKNCRKFYILGGSLAFLGSALSINQKDLLSLMVALILGSIIAFLGYIRYVKISKKGYKTVVGECYKIEYKIATMIKESLNMGGVQIPFRFLIKTHNKETDKTEVHQVFYYKGNQELKEGDKVKIYYEKDATFSDLNGVLGGSDVLGYEIIG